MNPIAALDRLTSELAEWTAPDAEAFGDRCLESLRSEGGAYLRGFNGRDFSHYVATMLREARPFFVAREMVDLTASAAPAMPQDHSFSALELPCPNGFALLGRPVPMEVDRELFDAPLAADREFFDVVLWSTVRSAEGRDVLAITLFGPRRPGEPSFFKPPIHVAFGDAESAESVFVNRPDRQFVRAFWNLVQTRVAVDASSVSPRAARRRAARAGVAEHDVTVVVLRRPANAGRPDADGRSVDWTHRWVVDGHWRQQWYPSLNEHRPIYVSPYVKGPEDKPLVIKERIHAWVR